MTLLIDVPHLTRSLSVLILQCEVSENYTKKESNFLIQSVMMPPVGIRRNWVFLNDKWKHGFPKWQMKIGKFERQNTLLFFFTKTKNIGLMSCCTHIHYWGKDSLVWFIRFISCLIRIIIVAAIAIIDKKK